MKTTCTPADILKDNKQKTAKKSGRKWPSGSGVKCRQVSRLQVQILMWIWSTFWKPIYQQSEPLKHLPHTLSESNRCYKRLKHQALSKNTSLKNQSREERLKSSETNLDAETRSKVKVFTGEVERWKVQVIFYKSQCLKSCQERKSNFMSENSAQLQVFFSKSMVSSRIPRGVNQIFIFCAADVKQHVGELKL